MGTKGKTKREQKVKKAKWSFYSPSDFLRPADEGQISEENNEPYRSAFRRDYARLIHSPAFRRLQGKKQLFPGIESDFFRNRLTHSLEVAQIGKSITLRLNHQLSKNELPSIDTDLVETICLAHDLGHPPFGHNGESALDDCMRGHGGFEGNAQTLRILSTLEKKRARRTSDKAVVIDDHTDGRYGLNLTYRTLASVLKYDKKIPTNRNQKSPLCKGYYQEDAELVSDIKEKVGNDRKANNFKTVECQIMDLADDIAYSTYDLEDAFKAGFLTPLTMLAASNDLLDRVAGKVYERTNSSGRKYASLSASTKATKIEKVLSILVDTFNISGLLGFTETEIGIPVSEFDYTIPAHAALLSAQATKNMAALSTDGYSRTEFTSKIVGNLIRGIKIVPNEKKPALSQVEVDKDILERIEVLKNFTFEAIIMSSRLKVSEFRGYEIVKAIYDAITSQEEGYLLLPDDYQRIYMAFALGEDEARRRRVVCDFVAGMTDRYAIEFYGRLKSERVESIFKPL